MDECVCVCFHTAGYHFIFSRPLKTLETMTYLLEITAVGSKRRTQDAPNVQIRRGKPSTNTQNMKNIAHAKFTTRYRATRTMVSMRSRSRLNRIVPRPSTNVCLRPMIFARSKLSLHKHGQTLTHQSGKHKGGSISLAHRFRRSMISTSNTARILHKKLGNWGADDTCTVCLVSSVASSGRISAAVAGDTDRILSLAQEPEDDVSPCGRSQLHRYCMLTERSIRFLKDFTPSQRWDTYTDLDLCSVFRAKFHSSFSKTQNVIRRKHDIAEP